MRTVQQCLEDLLQDGQTWLEAYHNAPEAIQQSHQTQYETLQGLVKRAEEILKTYTPTSKPSAAQEIYQQFLAKFQEVKALLEESSNT